MLFLVHPISDDPNDQLVLRIQGAVAEYERAVLGERFRRGRLQRARAGQYLAGGHAPYRYRYVRKREGLPGHLVIDEAEAEVVRALYQWLVDERLSIRQILGRLNFGPGAASWACPAGAATALAAGRAGIGASPSRALHWQLVSVQGLGKLSTGPSC